MKKKSIKRKALREMEYLIKLALEPETPLEYADRYVELARKISMRTRVRMPRYLKIYICRKCKRILRPGLTGIYRVRARPKKALYVKCLRCGYVHRYVYEKKQ